MSGAAKCMRLDWDSGFFGFGIGRIDAAHLDAETVTAARDWARASEVRCLYFLANADDAATTRAAERAGMACTDIRMTFEQVLGGEALALAQRSEACASPPDIRQWRPDDLPALRAIARSSHTDTRFYADPVFERERCDALYATWIERSCAGFAQSVLVAQDDDGRALGYVTGHLRDAVASLGLIAVAPEAQGRGLGPRMVNAFLAWGAGQRATRATVVTQGRNVRAQRLYQRCGFVTSAVQIWYHFWPLD